MKNRKSIIAAFLVIAVMLFSVGYAALSDKLDINGTSDANLSAAQKNFDTDVYFSAAVANNEGNVASIAEGDNDMASFTANTLAKKGDKVSFTFTITNNSPHDVVVTPTLAADGNSNTAFYAITSSWEGNAKTILAGQAMEYIVYLELIDDPTDAVHGAFHIELTAVAGGAVVEGE